PNRSAICATSIIPPARGRVLRRQARPTVARFPIQSPRACNVAESPTGALLRPCARIGDLHTCPASTGPVPHVGGALLGPGAGTVLVAGLPAAVLGDAATCVGPPSTVLAGSGTVL